MAQPTYNDIDHGQQSWDADLQANIDAQRVSVIVPEYANFAALPAVADNDNCLAVTTDTNTMWKSDGTDWVAQGGGFLPFGANFNTAGFYALANGINTAADMATLNYETEAPAPRGGTIASLSWNTNSADATTIMKILVQGIVAETITLSGAQGAIYITTGSVVAFGDRIALEWDAGTAPAHGTYQIHIA